MSPQRSNPDLEFEDPLDTSGQTSLALRSPLSSERVLGYVLWAVLAIVVFGVGTSS